MVLSIPQIIVTFVAAMGVPSALTSYMLSRHEKRLEKRDEQREKERVKKEKDMDKHQLLLLETINASLALGEATARGCPAYSGCEMQRRYARSPGVCSESETRAERFPPGTGTRKST